MSLKNKRIVLIGGTSGFGFATAQAAAQQQAELVIVSGKQENVSRALQQLPANAKGFAVNVSDEDAVKDLFNSIGAFDHLVYTAGEPLQFTNFENISFTEARHFFETRFWGSMMVAKYAAPRIRKSGSITLTNGIVGLRPLKGWTVAASICGAMEALTRALAVELAPVRVNAVCAGVVKTNLWSNIPEADRNAMFEQMAGVIPVGRVGEASDLAKTYIHLMEQEFASGQCMVIDGGAVLV